jgi:hypothetical protein
MDPRDTGNIGHKTREQINKAKNTTQTPKVIGNTDLLKNPGGTRYSRANSKQFQFYKKLEVILWIGY